MKTAGSNGYSAAFQSSLPGCGVHSAPVISPKFYPARSCLIHCLNRCRRQDVLPTQFIVLVQVRTQTLWIVERHLSTNCLSEDRHYYFTPVRTHRMSTSRFGIGQVEGSNKTPLGLHRIDRKIGGGLPVGTVYKGRRPVGSTWQAMANAPIAHRILWLRGLEQGFNAGGNVDSFARYIYIHGVGDEATIGRPASCGCVHLAANDLLPFFDNIPIGTLVHIE